MNNDLISREDCPMRHENGNCLPCGGFCLSVNDEICGALHNAFESGKRTVDAVEEVHANWEYIPIIGSLGRYRCERCFHYVDAGTDRNYCPNCGADMRGE